MTRPRRTARRASPALPDRLRAHLQASNGAETLQDLMRRFAPAGRTTIWQALDKLVQEGQVERFKFNPRSGAMAYRIGDTSTRPPQDVLAPPSAHPATEHPATGLLVELQAQVEALVTERDELTAQLASYRARMQDALSKLTD